MVTRTKDGTRKPKAFLSPLDTTHPVNTKQALQHDDWYKSMKDEFEAHLRNENEL